MSALLTWLPGLIAGCVTGLLSAFGLGGGTLLLLWLTLFAGVPQQAAQAINLVYFLPVSAGAIPAHARNGYLDGGGILWAAAAGAVAAAAAAWLATWLETELLRTLFGVYLLAMGVLELVGSQKRTDSSDRG
ncbi:MAG: TSUP family transporter [Clostridiales bacterium]|nr:TSUP family transporter [Clostridiales bacterium]